MAVDKSEMFRAAINKQADDEIAELTAKLRAKKNAAGKAKAELAVREELAAVHAEQNAAETRFKKEMSRCDFETARAVRVHRKELIDGFFEEIRGDLVEFTKSTQYDGYLWNSLKKAEEAFGKNCVILAAVKDVSRLVGITKLEVRADNSILIGGICALDEKRGLFADLSLDKALDDEMEAFSQRSELRL
ncbi:MAG: hypothetical protein K2N56_04430 [Oscillospiraceae bacterium]|nr:hypothetical protein [Oscillospiraceae bacterium]